MDNRFKFRVWNKVRQCFMPEKEIFICGNGELVLIDEALNRTWVKDNPNYEVSLCTGLHDKNDKLVYEGDVLKLAEFAKPVEVKHRALGFVLRREPSNTVGYDNDKYIPEDCEVIGNIYENKELLDE